MKQLNHFYHSSSSGSGEDKNILDQVKSSGVSDDDIAKIASNVIQGMMTRYYY